MCGFVGIAINKKEKINSINKEMIKKMNDTLGRRGPDEEGYYIDKLIALGHKRLSVIDIENGKQPMKYTYKDEEYIIVYNGQIYNTEELRRNLEENEIPVNSNSDTEILLKSYILYKEDIVKHLNGIFAFAIWNKEKETVFLARDHFGVKPLYYTICEENLIFASELKAIFEYPGFKKILDKEGIGELFGIGPAHTPGKTVFKNVFEIKPGNYAIYSEGNLETIQYWKLKSQPHYDDFSKTCDTIKNLLKDSIEKQLISDRPLCTFLSGGLDSSIITYYASEYNKEHELGKLHTYSVDYLDNDKNFIKSDFQPNSDGYYINLVNKKLHTKHNNIVIDTPELADYLYDAMIARDMPGMADIDSSLLIFCKNVKKDMTVALSGECADEIFGGYPWFFSQDQLDSNTFPWSTALDERQKLININISSKINLKEYVQKQYNESLENVEILNTDSEETANKRKITYLTMNWFMQTLLDRSDRMSMYNGLEIRVPFCDYRIAPYVYNIPWEVKALNGREKGLLRYICKKTLPDEIIDRKKSPYPKTHNPTYLNKVTNMLIDIIKDDEAPINKLLNRKYILEILNTKGKNLEKPWFGQLMTYPQLLAYIIQVNMWLDKYKPEIEI